MRRTIQWMVSFTMVLVARTASATCVRDIDCPGDLVCIEGECARSATDRAPAPVPTPAPPISTPSPPLAEPGTAAVPPTETVTPTAEAAPPDSGATAAPATASKECLKDMDCKGDRICKEGACVDPEPAPVSGAAAAPAAVIPPPSPAPIAPAPVRRADDGWALGGAIAGFVAVVPVTVFSALSIVNIDYSNPAIPFGATALAFVMSVGPVVHASSASARKSGVRGSLGLRIPAWILYGFTIGVGVSLLAIGLADGVDVHIWQIALAMTMGDLSLGFFTADALIARTQARRLMRQQQAESVSTPITLSPTFSPVIGSTGTTGGIIGLGGRF